MHIPSGSFESFLDAALRYAYNGFWVVPLVPGGKHPIRKGWRDHATHDLDVVREIWTAHPDANVGISTDELAVVDVDHDGSEYLTPARRAALESARAITITPRGKHYIFQQPVGGHVRCSGGLLGVGIDIRADGGLIVLPPSINAAGVRYEFADGRCLLCMARLTELPQIILDDIARCQPRGAGRADRGGFGSASFQV